MGLASALVICVPEFGWAQATDLVCGQCVETGDIANEAATGAKLASNAVNNSKIGNGAVNAAKLAANAVTVAKIANNAVSTPKLATAGVTRPKIAPNAVNASKIANAAVTAAKIAPDAVNRFKIADGAVTADKLGIAHTVFVGDSGDAAANCTALQDALDGLVGPAAVWLGPGTYACGESPVVLTSGISLVGVDRNLVTITGETAESDGLVRIQGDDVLLRGVTVRNDGQGDILVTGASAAIVVGAAGVDSRRWRIIDVVADAFNGPAASYGIIARSVDCDGGEVVRATLSATDADFDNDGLRYDCSAGTSTVTEVTVTGIESPPVALTKSNAGSSLTVRNSSMPRAALLAGGLRLISSEVGSTSGAGLICVGSYDETGTALSDGATGSGGCS